MKNDNYRVVLTGHGVGEPPATIRNPTREMWMSEEHFVRILDALAPTSELTFDDGFKCCLEIVVPLLVSRGIRATFFVSWGHVNTPGYLSEEDLREMCRLGMEIGTHGMYHRPWKKLKGITLREEIIDAKSQLEDVLDRPITKAACPFGAYDRRSLKALKRSGIESVYTSDRALWRSKSPIIPRYTIRSSDTHKYIEEVISGKHDASILGKIKMFAKRCL
ncbi:MAG: polysaccharide deacetylase family protein [Candidatus Hydrogenedentes bacterium]|nr:polysaccharide deacetylase family protein [Candidatus Hydrogenedentota bacterium]